jgi:hypothetical protein
MTPKRAIRIMLALVCLASAGCAAVGRHPGGGQQARSEPEIRDNHEHFNLERELSLYSD